MNFWPRFSTHSSSQRYTLLFITIHFLCKYLLTLQRPLYSITTFTSHPSNLMQVCQFRRFSYNKLFVSASKKKASFMDDGLKIKQHKHDAEEEKDFL